jgi:WD40 repeat protein
MHLWIICSLIPFIHLLHIIRSGDATARIWSIPEGSFKAVHTGRNINALILKHAKGKSNEKSKDVTTLDWNGEGTLLATGSCDGQARIWTLNGMSTLIFWFHSLYVSSPCITSISIFLKLILFLL